MQSFGYIYLTTNSINAIGYIGQCRGAFKPNYRGSGKILVSAINKYGKHNFETEVIEWCDSQAELNQAEIDHIAIMRAFGGRLYNIHPGGSGHAITEDGIERIRRAQTGRKHSPETIEKMSLAKKGRPGRPLSPELKALLIKANTGAIRSDECRARMRAAKVGKPGHPLSPEHKEKLLKAVTGRTPSVETRAKQSAAKKGKPSGRIFSQESRERMSRAHTGKVVSEETRSKLSAARKGKPWTDKMRASIQALKQSREMNHVTI